MVKNKDMQFFMDNFKMKRKKDKKILTFRSGDLNSRFPVIFPPMIWIFMESEEDEIKPKHVGTELNIPWLYYYYLMIKFLCESIALCPGLFFVHLIY